MKIAANTTRVLALTALLAGPGTADSEPPPQLQFSRAAQGTWATDWIGDDLQTYFFQWSTDMVNWYYAPFIDYGAGSHSRGCASSSPSFFVRLHHGEFEGIDSLEKAENGDIDGDGLTNLFEVTFGYDPFDVESTAGGLDNLVDPDEDGMGNSTEQLKALDPMHKDNPKVMLQVMDY